MELSDIVKSSFRYPFDIQKGIIISILTIIGNLAIVLPFLLQIEDFNININTNFDIYFRIWNKHS